MKKTSCNFQVNFPTKGFILSKESLIKEILGFQISKFTEQKLRPEDLGILDSGFRLRKQLNEIQTSEFRIQKTRKAPDISVSPRLLGGRAASSQRRCASEVFSSVLYICTSV